MKKIISILTFVLICVMNSKAQQTSREDYVFLAKVEVNGSPALIDFDGNYMVRPGRYENDDTNGKVVVPVEFYVQDFLPEFNCGRLGIRKWTNSEIKAGYIDTEGNEVIPCRYDEVSPFKKISVK